MALEVDPKGLTFIFSNSDKETELAKLFSGEAAVKSSEDSLLFLKKIVAISVSNLLYLRNVLPDISFMNFICDKSMKLNLLCPIQANNNSHRKAKRIIGNLLDVFVGIEDRNVETFAISFVYKDVEDVAVTEIYRFHFEYKDEVSVTFSKDTSTEEDNNQVATLYTKNAKQLIGNTRALIRQIQTTCNRMAPIPEDADTRVDLRVFFNSNAPADYSLPGWIDAKVNLPTAFDGKQRESQLWLGQVITPFHSMKLEHEALEGETDYFKNVYGED